jgi:hypothetical protein
MGQCRNYVHDACALGLGYNGACGVRRSTVNRVFNFHAQRSGFRLFPDKARCGSANSEYPTSFMGEVSGLDSGLHFG